MTELSREISQVWSRLFDHRPFLNGEIKFMLKEFEEKRGDREVENLFAILENLTDIKDTQVEKIIKSSNTALPVLGEKLNQALKLSEEIEKEYLEVQKAYKQKVAENRERRQKDWDQFIDDMNFRCQRIDNTFEEKEEELRDFIDNQKPIFLTTSDIEKLKKIEKLFYESDKTSTCKDIPKYEDNDNILKVSAEKDINDHVKGLSKESINKDKISKASAEEDINNHVRDLSNGSTNEGDKINISNASAEKDTDNHVNDFSKESINKEDKDDISKTSAKNDKNHEKENLKEDSNEKHKDEVFLVRADLNWLYDYLQLKRSNGDKDTPYLHTLLADAHIEVPKNEMIKRNPVLEARCVKLRSQQEAREYRKMTKGVDNVRMRFPEDSISYQLKQMNRQLIAIGQFIISIFAGFLFGFRGVEWMVGNLDFGFRLLLGVMCALVIALAEIYFLAKKLNEELCIPETVQLGGPLKFAENSKNGLEKQHQD
ncbi:unnamed protein product, partial [Brenthis ino]